jgi:hypothetical protein
MVFKMRTLFCYAIAAFHEKQNIEVHLMIVKSIE